MTNKSNTSETASSADSAQTDIQSLQMVAGEGLQITDCKIGEPSAFEVEIAPEYSYISAGTELNSLQAFQTAVAGSREPGRLGYSQSGRVLRVGSRVVDIAPGDRVVAVGAGAFHATRTRVGQNLVTRVPEGVCMRQAALAAMFCFALEGVEKSQLRIGEHAVVFGAGMMGQMAARLFQLSGAKVCVMDLNQYRLGLLPEDIESFTLDESGWKGIGEWSQPYGVEHASICFGGDATAVIESLKPLMSVAPDGVPHGRIVFPGGASFTALMASNMGNMQFISSAKAGPGYRDPIYEGGQDYPSVYVSHPVRRNVKTMMLLMRDGRLDLSKLVTHEFAFSSAKDAYDMLQQPNVEALAVLLAYGDGCANN